MEEQETISLSHVEVFVFQRQLQLRKDLKAGCNFFLLLSGRTLQKTCRNRLNSTLNSYLLIGLGKIEIIYIRFDT